MPSSKLPLVYISGVITSAVTMIIVFLLMALTGFSLLGFYVWIFPVGSLIAGIAAGSGYAASSRLLNVNTGKFFAVSAGIIAFLVYASAHYIVFALSSGDASIAGFIRNTLDSASNSSLTIGKSYRSTIDNVGIAGYAFLALEYLGFIAGSSLTALNGAKGSTYCEGCKKYFKPVKEKLYYMPALEKADLDGLSAVEKSSGIAANASRLRDELGKIRDEVKGKTLAETLEYLRALAGKSTYRTSFYMTFGVQSCPQCGDHDIQTQFFLNTDENQGQVTTSEAPISNRRNSGVPASS